MCVCMCLYIYLSRSMTKRKILANHVDFLLSPRYRCQDSRDTSGVCFHLFAGMSVSFGVFKKSSPLHDLKINDREIWHLVHTLPMSISKNGFQNSRDEGRLYFLIFVLIYVFVLYHHYEHKNYFLLQRVTCFNSFPVLACEIVKMFRAIP